MFDEMPKIFREYLINQGYTLEVVKKNPDIEKRILDIAKDIREGLDVLRGIADEKEVPWEIEIDALEIIIWHTYGSVENTEKMLKRLANCLARLMMWLPQDKAKKIIYDCLKDYRERMKLTNKLCEEYNLGTELLIDSQSKTIKGEKIELNFEISDEELEQILYKAMRKEVIRLHLKGEIKDWTLKFLNRDFKAEHPSEPEITGEQILEWNKTPLFKKLSRKQKPSKWTREYFNLVSQEELKVLCQPARKEAFIELLIYFPGLMTRKIEIAKASSEVPPVLLRFAERWRKETA